MRRSLQLSLLAIVASALVLAAAAQRRPPLQQAPQRENPAANKGAQEAQVRKLFEEMFNGRNYGLKDQVFASNCTVHFGNRSLGIQQAMAEGRSWHNASPDLKITINSMNVNGDTVTVNWTTRGTHTGQGLGVKPTNKTVNVRSRSEFRFANGKIVEATNEEYRPEVFRQLGVPKGRAFMFYATESVLAVLNPIIPNRFWLLF
jgi:predicted ester cyclase